MATSYTSLLGFALPVTGELQGTWGDTVNNSITQLCEDSIAGVATASVLSSDWTLTTTGAGAANQARMAILIPTGSPSVSRNIIAPSKSKTYTVINQSNAAVVIKGAATTGVSVASGDTVIVAWNGSDFVAVKNADGTFTNLTYTGTLTGSTGVMNIGSGQLYKDASGNVGIGTSSPAYKLEVRGGVIAGGNGTIVGGISYSTRPEIGAISNHPVGFITNNTTQMLIDTSGNVGIGTSSPFAKLSISNAGAQGLELGYSSGLSANFIQSINRSTGADVDLAYYLAGGSGTHKFYTASTEKMRIDASGNVGIGTSSPSSYGKFAVSTATANDGVNIVFTGSPGTAAVGTNFWLTNNTTVIKQAYINAQTDGGSVGAENAHISFGTIGSGTLSERMRIDSSGNLLVGTTSGSYKITCNGQPGANGYTAWTNYSDQRLKENIADFNGGLKEILKLKPKSFNYNELSGYDEETRARTVSGFIAQELQLVCPEMVGTTKINGVEYLDTNTSNLNLLLVKAIQELKAELDDLKSQLGK